MRITKEILSKAKDKARNHIKLVNQDGYDKGAIDYILKPFAPDHLLDRLEEILTKLAAEREI